MLVKPLVWNLKLLLFLKKKSRIERLWGSLLSRLSIELRLAGINNIEDANKFLITYTTKYNDLFALPIDYTTSVFVKADKSLINNTLAIISTRVFDKGCSIKYKNKIYLAYKGKQQMNFSRNTKCLVIKTFDDRLLCNVDDELYQLVELEDRQQYSKNFDLEQQEKKIFNLYSSVNSSLENGLISSLSS